MPRVVLTAPPDLGVDAEYKAYKDWLLDNYYDHLCSYCLLRDDDAEVDHYEPRGYAPDRVHDPKNLLLACARCNGAGGKSDYHPRHADRWKKRHDTSGHMVIDSRVDDFALLYEIQPNGAIDAKPGISRDRAAWNIALLKLDLGTADRSRREILGLLQACELAVGHIEAGNQPEQYERMLVELLPQLAGYRLFLRTFGVVISTNLEARLATAR
jgi:hypothetical protein